MIRLYPSLSVFISLDAREGFLITVKPLFVSGRPGVIRDFQFSRGGDGSIILVWKPPEVQGGKNLKYYVYYSDIIQTIKSPPLTIKSQTEDTSYVFKVRTDLHDVHISYSATLKDLNI